MRDDGGAMQTLEAMLIALVLVGSVGFAVTFSLPSQPNEPARIKIEDNVEDALGVMAETPIRASAFGDQWLSRALSQCMLRDCGNLTDRLDSLLPPGTRYNVWLSNGYDDYPVYVPELPRGETVASTKYIEPKWSFTFLGLDYNLTNVATSEPLNVFALPIQNSNVVSEGGTPVVAIVKGTRSDGGNVTFSAYSSTIQVAPGDRSSIPAVSLTWRDWYHKPAGVLNVSNVTQTNVSSVPTGVPSGTKVPLRLRVENDLLAAPVPAGSKIRIDVPRDWTAIAPPAKNPGWTIVSAASDYNATFGASHVEASIDAPLAPGDSLTFTIEARLHGTSKDYYLFPATFGLSTHARAELVVRANLLPTPSRIDYPAVAFTTPKPMGADQRLTWTLGVSAPLRNASGVSNVFATITRVEVYAPGYDLFKTGSLVPLKTEGGTWTKEGQVLVWKGEGRASNGGAFELTWTVEGNGKQTPSSMWPAAQIPLRFGSYTGYSTHQFSPGFYVGEIYPSGLDTTGTNPPPPDTRPGYDPAIDAPDYWTKRPFSANPALRSIALWGHDNYTASAIPSYRDASSGGYFEPSKRRVGIGEEVTLAADAQSLILQLSTKGRTASAAMRLYPPFAVDRKVPVWENESLDTTLLSGDIKAMIAKDLNGDGVLDVVVGTAGGRVLGIDGRNGQRIPGLGYKAPAYADTAAAVTHLQVANLDGNAVIVVGTDRNGPFVHAIDAGFLEIYRWAKPSAVDVVAIDAGTVDLDYDGVMDVLVGLANGRVYALSGEFDGSGWFETLRPPASPSNDHWYDGPGKPDGGLVGLNVMGPWRERGFATSMNTVPSVWNTANVLTADPSRVDPNDPASFVLAPLPQVGLPAAGMEGVNENGSVMWTFYGFPISKSFKNDVDGDGVDDVVVGSSGGFVAALDGAQASQPIYSLLFPGIDPIVGSHALSETHVAVITKLGRVITTDDAFATQFCVCDPLTHVPLPLAGAKNVSLTPAGEVWAVGAAGVAYKGTPNVDTRMIVPTPVIWGASDPVESCTYIVTCTWTSSSVPIVDMNDVHFTPGGHGFIVGEKCATCLESLVMKREAGQATWRILSKTHAGLNGFTDPFVTAKLRQVAFTDETLGWILGDQGTLLRTLDGGDTWRTIPLPAALADHNLTGISCIPSSSGHTCLLVASKTLKTGAVTKPISAVYKTTKGSHASLGASDWAPLATHTDRHLLSIGCATENRCFIGGKDTILATWDGGLRWTRVPMNYVASAGNDIQVWPSGHGYVLGGNASHARIFSIRDYAAISRAESTSIWSCNASCVIKDVTLRPDASYVANGTDIGAAWAQYFVRTGPTKTWRPFVQASGGMQVRGSETLDPLDVLTDGGNQLYWRTYFNVSHDVSFYSPVVRKLVFHVNYTEDGQPKYAAVTQTFGSEAFKHAPRTSADWNTTLGVLRAPFTKEHWVQNVNGSVTGMAYGDVTGDGVPDVAVGTGKKLALNDPASVDASGSDPSTVMGQDYRVYLLDGAANGARLWRSVQLSGEVRAIAIADLQHPQGAPDGYKDIVVATWNGRGGQVTAFAGADGAIIWNVTFGRVPTSAVVGTTPATQGIPMPIIGSEAQDATGLGLAHAFNYKNGKVLWTGVPEERGHYNVTIQIPRGAPFGPYVMEFELTWDEPYTDTTSGQPVTKYVVQAARFYNYFNVVPPDAAMPLSPIYTVKVVAWLGDWDYSSTRAGSGSSGSGSGPNPATAPAVVWKPGSGVTDPYKGCLMQLCSIPGGSDWLAPGGKKVN